MTTRLLTISVVVLGFCACGPGAKITGGKQGAAEALFASSQPTGGGASKLGSGIDLNFGGEISVACKEGGSTVLKGFGFVLDTTGGAKIGQSFTAEYRGCGVKTSSGKAELNGSLTVSQQVAATTGSATIEQSLKGKILWQGACDDFLDIDVLQKVSATSLSATGGGVSMILKGSVADSEGSFSFDEEVSVTPGNVTVKIEASK